MPDALVGKAGRLDSAEDGLVVPACDFSTEFLQHDGLSIVGLYMVAGFPQSECSRRLWWELQGFS